LQRHRFPYVVSMQAVHNVAFGRGMMEIKLEPDLSHCVETVAKREYERVLSILLRGDYEDKQLEDALELLRLFLESADFGSLRSRCEELLLQGRQVKVKLRSTSGIPEYDIEVN
jgi:hypothetical protein